MDRPMPIPEQFNGPLFIGSIAMTFFFGMYLIQAHRYSMNASTDGWVIPSVVAFLTVLELVGIGVTLYCVYIFLCFSSVGPTPTFGFPSASIAIPVLTVMTTSIVQSFFAWRIYTLGRSQRRVWPRVMAVFVVLLALTQLSSNVVVAIQTASFGSDTTKFHKNEVPVKIWLITAVICDAVMSGTLIALLYRYTKGARTRSRGMVNRLMRNTVENGLVTAVSATCQLITYVALPNTLVHVGFAYVGARLYSIVFIASLNARKDLREDIMQPTASFSGRSRSDQTSVPDRPLQSVATKDRFRAGLTGGPEERSIHLTNLGTKSVGGGNLDAEVMVRVDVEKAVAI